MRETQWSTRAITIVCLMMLLMTGCDSDDERVAEMATEQAERQALQSREMVKLQHEIAEGSHELIESNGKAREAVMKIHRDLQQERAEIGKQRDTLEGERRDIAAKRQREPVMAEAIKTIGMVLACLLPVGIAAYLLLHYLGKTEQESLGELLIKDMTAMEPALLPPPEFHHHPQSRIEFRTRVPDDEDSADSPIDSGD